MQWCKSLPKSLTTSRRSSSFAYVSEDGCYVCDEMPMLCDDPIATTSSKWLNLLTNCNVTNCNFATRTSPLAPAGIADVVACYHPENRHDRRDSARVCAPTYDERIKPDEASLDLFWQRDRCLDEADMLPSPELPAASVVEDLQAALEQFAAIIADLSEQQPAW